ncbi:MAG: flavodoxin-dependent (E)-4-hydroxy-3-methylbut-2-enyl-diphosphate synthase [Fibrobacteres bacterium]|nr:flavodoxin-dependent (E)-4-hydroxy-3-methylbut-2-enyl-diphosphate synthase [Fibrobacterota bacterium]
MRVPTRRKTRSVKIGKLSIGGGAPVLVQSMTCTKTSDVSATLLQIDELEKAGCEIIRVAVPDKSALDALPAIKASCPMPLVADIHFNLSFALGAIEAGCDKIRINPGNLGGLDNFKKVLSKAAEKGCAIRIGVNSGSVEKALLEKYGGPTTEAMVQSALQYLEVCNDEKFDQIVISIKASSTLEAVEANRRFSELSDFPLHLGITEAGTPGYGALKSAVGIGSLLLDGIGDTIRVSLTGNPVNEIPVAYDILKASGVRIVTPEVVSCPTCGRLQYGMEDVAKEIEKRLASVRKPLRVAVMGCLVNGPGEAREADIALAGGKGEAVLYKKGVEIGKIKETEMVDAVVKAAMEW